MSITARLVTIDDYDGIFALWNSTEQSKRALNLVDDSREGIAGCASLSYIRVMPTFCHPTGKRGRNEHQSGLAYREK